MQAISGLSGRGSLLCGCMSGFKGSERCKSFQMRARRPNLGKVVNKQHEHKDQLHVVKRRDMQGRTCTDCTSLLKLEVLAAASVAVALQLAHCPAHALAAIPPPRTEAEATHMVPVERVWLERLLVEEMQSRVSSMSDTELVGTLDQLLAKKHSQQPFPAALLERPSTPSSFATPPSSPSAALPSSPSQPSLSASIPQTSRQGRALSPSLPPLASPSAPYLPPTVAPLQAPRDRGPQSSREGDYLRRLGSDAGTGEPQRAPARPGRVGSEESSDETARLLESAGLALPSDPPAGEAPAPAPEPTRVADLVLDRAAAVFSSQAAALGDFSEKFSTTASGWIDRARQAAASSPQLASARAVAAAAAVAAARSAPTWFPPTLAAAFLALCAAWARQWPGLGATGGQARDGGDAVSDVGAGEAEPTAGAAPRSPSARSGLAPPPPPPRMPSASPFPAAASASAAAGPQRGTGAQRGSVSEPTPALPLSLSPASAATAVGEAGWWALSLVGLRRTTLGPLLPLRDLTQDSMAPSDPSEDPALYPSRDPSRDPSREPLPGTDPEGVLWVRGAGDGYPSSSAQTGVPVRGSAEGAGLDSQGGGGAPPPLWIREEETDTEGSAEGSGEGSGGVLWVREEPAVSGGGKGSAAAVRGNGFAASAGPAEKAVSGAVGGPEGGLASGSVLGSGLGSGLGADDAAQRASQELLPGRGARGMSLGRNPRAGLYDNVEYADVGLHFGKKDKMASR